MLEWIGKRYMRMQRIRHEEGGFTLIELIVVVVIIGILAAIAIPVFLGQRARAADARAKANVREAALAVNVDYTEEGEAPAVPTPIGDLRGSGFQQSDPPVVLFAEGGPSNANWCLSTPTNGGERAHWMMRDEDGAPVGSDAPCANANGPAGP